MDGTLRFEGDANVKVMDDKIIVGGYAKVYTEKEWNRMTIESEQLKTLKEVTQTEWADPGMVLSYQYEVDTENFVTTTFQFHPNFWDRLKEIELRGNGFIQMDLSERYDDKTKLKICGYGEMVFELSSKNELHELDIQLWGHSQFLGKNLRVKRLASHVTQNALIRGVIVTEAIQSNVFDYGFSYISVANSDVETELNCEENNHIVILSAKPSEKRSRNT